ncbi:MAG: hypothetical protein HN337_03380 [Deltaproteobacteria bacterium]|jgi:hypothetical protein|nr:hypothetical protein [Deltaproteobacteria bacterium]
MVSDSTVRTRPVVILPFQRGDEGEIPHRLTPGEAGSHTKLNFSGVQWAWLAARRPRLARAYMDNADNPGVLGTLIAQMAEAVATMPDLSALPDEDLPPWFQTFDSNDYVDITTRPAGELLQVLRRVNAERFVLHSVSNPNEGRWRVELHKISEQVTEVALNAWRHSSLHMLGQDAASVLRDMLTDREVADTFHEGARVFIAPHGDTLALPHILNVSRGGNGGDEFFISKPGASPNGSSVELVLPDSVRERFRIIDIIDRLEALAVEAYEENGTIPTLFLDLDGTLFSVRQFVLNLFLEWMDQSTNPKVDMVRETLEAYLATGKPLTTWDAETIFADLGIKDREIIDEAQKYHKANFSDAVRSIEEKEKIEGMVHFVRFLKRRLKARGVPLKTIFASIRNKHKDMLINGASASYLALVAAGLWDELSEAMLDDGERNAIHDGAHGEPKKADTIELFMDKRPELYYLGLADNTTEQTNRCFHHPKGKRSVVIHVKRDDPPDSTDSLQAGALSMDPFEAYDELAVMNENRTVDFADLPLILRHEAFAPIIRGIRQASELGKRPVVTINLDDSAITTSTRVKKILLDFLDERFEWGTSKEWVLDIARKFNPVEVEYLGAGDVLRDAGLEGLGLEDEFETYLAEHFLSDVHLKKASLKGEVLTFLHSLRALNVKIAYISGRLHTLADGTRSNMRLSGFPVLDRNAAFAFRSEPEESARVFKGHAIPTLVGSDHLVAAIDSNPEGLSVAAKRNPDAALYLVGERYRVERAAPPKGTIFINGFSGAINAQPHRPKPLVGDKIRGKGSRLAGYIKGGLNDLGNASMRRDLVKMLGELAGLDTDHPKSIAAFAELNRLIRDDGRGAYARFDHALRELNGMIDVSFAALRSNVGVGHFLRSSNGFRLPDDITPIVSGGMTAARCVTPVAHENNSWISGALQAIQAGPDLSQVDESELVDLLVRGGLKGTFARADLAIGALIGGIQKFTGKAVADISVLEDNPGFAISSMTTLAQMGAKVSWSSDDSIDAIHTEHALLGLPGEVRSNIERAGSEATIDAKLVVGAGGDLTLDQLGASANFLILQGHRLPDYYSGRMGSSKNWNLQVHVPIQPGSYVLPFMQTNPAFVTPTSFQIWQAARMV